MILFTATSAEEDHLNILPKYFDEFGLVFSSYKSYRIILSLKLRRQNRVAFVPNQMCFQYAL